MTRPSRVRVDPFEDASALGAVEELRHRAWNKVECGREVTDAHGVSRRRRLDDQQEQVLARGQACCAYGSFRDRVKPSHGEPERGRALESSRLGVVRVVAMQTS